MRTGVSARSARHVLEAAAPVDRRALCDAAGIDLAMVDTESSVPYAQLVALYRHAALHTGDDAFGLHVGEGVDLRAFDIIGYVAIHSATVGEALARIVRYFPLWTTSAVLSLDVDRSSARLAWMYVDGAIDLARQDVEMTLVTLSRIRGLAREGGLAGPREVRFRHRKPRDVSEHRRLFQTHARFGMSANELVYDREALDTPLSTADSRLSRILVDYAEQLLARITPTAIDRARAILDESIVDLAALAKRMGTSTRSLQRILRAHGTSYRELVDDVRRRLAMTHLRDGQLTVGEVADRLGYGHPAELHRAFRAWTGTTPRRYRGS